VPLEQIGISFVNGSVVEAVLFQDLGVVDAVILARVDEVDLPGFVGERHRPASEENGLPPGMSSKFLSTE